jgi:hypothetical protein
LQVAGENGVEHSLQATLEVGVERVAVGDIEFMADIPLAVEDFAVEFNRARAALIPDYFFDRHFDCPFSVSLAQFQHFTPQAWE